MAKSRTSWSMSATRKESWIIPVDPRRNERQGRGDWGLITLLSCTKAWWQVQDSNLCRLSPTDLQSLPLAARATCLGAPEPGTTPPPCE